MIIEKVKKYIQEQRLLEKNDRVIIGLSGGPDSVFLLHCLLQLQQEYNLNLIAIHLNHEWRIDADQDVDFCRRITEQQTIPFITTKASSITLEKQANGSLEEHGRLLRRHFFEYTAQEHTATKIALGHHRDDQAETFFIRLLRGASLTGLTGMRPQQGIYIRPLLSITKQEIIAYLDEHKISYLTDPTNKDETYLRNSIRLNVLPTLRATDDRFDITFQRTLERLQEVELFLEKLTKELYATIMVPHEGSQLLDLHVFATLDLLMQQRIIIHWLCQERAPFTPSQGFLQETMQFLLAPQGGTHQLGTHWTLAKKRGWAWITQKNQILS
jgi:tRNA(Ile)-lysidine synthase